MEREAAANAFALVATTAIAVAAEYAAEDRERVEDETKLDGLLDSRYFYMRTKLDLPVKLPGAIQETQLVGSKSSSTLLLNTSIRRIRRIFCGRYRGATVNSALFIVKLRVSRNEQSLEKLSMMARFSFFIHERITVELNELLISTCIKKLGLRLNWYTDEVQAAMDQEHFNIDNVEAVGINASLVIVRLRSLVVGDEDEMMVHLHMVSKLQSLVYHGIACPQTLAYALLLLFRYYTRIKRDLEKISKNGWGERAEAFRQVIREQDIEKMFLAALTHARWQCIKDM
ncbi:hypothetical protein HDU97_008250 [Phlyctochytrium planicorne]|nr:hypothetical protein HDU97_008250 [Phlyctochytrium planicorne]